VSGQPGTAKTIVMNITASADPDFLISTNQSGSVVIYQGQSESVDVSITAVNGFNSEVTFSVTGTTPTGLSSSFTPSSVTGSGTTSLELSASASADIGGTSITIEATDGSKTHTLDLPVTIEEVPEPDFRLEGDATTVTATTSNPGLLVLDVVRLHGHTGEITFSTSDLPTGVTADFTPSSLTGSATSTNLTLTVDNTVTSSDDFFTITATSGSIERSWTIMLSLVNEDPPGYSLTFSPDPVTVQRGTSGTFTILIDRTGNYTGDVTMNTSASFLVSGATLSYDNPAFSGDIASITATIDIPADAEVKTHVGTVYSNPEGLEGSTFKIHNYSVIVTDTPVESDFSIASNIQNVSVAQGQSSDDITVSLTPTGSFNEQVDFTAENLPTGVTANFSPTSLTGSGSSTLTFSATADATIGTTDITIKGTASSGTKTITLSLSVTGTSSVANPKKTKPEILLYPNPVTDVVNIQSSTTSQQVNIYTLQSKLVQQTQFNSKEVQLDVSALNKGVYLIEIISMDEKRVIKKIIKL
jgi:hypothetical protein